MKHLFLPLEHDPEDRPNAWVALPLQQLQGQLTQVLQDAVPSQLELAGSNCTIMTVTRKDLNLRGLVFSASHLIREADDHDLEQNLNQHRPFYSELLLALGLMPDHASPVTLTAMTACADDLQDAKNPLCWLHNDDREDLNPESTPQESISTVAIRASILTKYVTTSSS